MAAIPPLKVRSRKSETLTIGKSLLVVTANNKTKVYGQSNPTLDGSVVGIVAGDNITATYTTTATQLSNVTAGGFGITPHVLRHSFAMARPGCAIGLSDA